MKNLYLTALLKHAAAAEFEQSDPLIKQALVSTGAKSIQRGFGRLLGRNTDDLTKSINKSKADYIDKGLDKAFGRAMRDGDKSWHAGPDGFRLTQKADAVEKWAPRAAGILGLTGLAGGSAYGSSQYTRNHIANKVDDMSTSQSLAAALALIFNRGNLSDRIRG